MNTVDAVDILIAKHPDWRGAKLASRRTTILEVDPAVFETWNWLGSPVWEKNSVVSPEAAP